MGMQIFHAKGSNLMKTREYIHQVRPPPFPCESTVSRPRPASVLSIIVHRAEHLAQDDESDDEFPSSQVLGSRVGASSGRVNHHHHRPLSWKTIGPGIPQHIHAPLLFNKQTTNCLSPAWLLHRECKFITILPWPYSAEQKSRDDQDECVRARQWASQ